MLGEDSGVEVEGLGGGPGVALGALGGGPGCGASCSRSSRASQGEGRRARYVCELVASRRTERSAAAPACSRAGSPSEPRGSEGFGYDPIFVPEGEDRTVAELGNDWKREQLAPRPGRPRPARLDNALYELDQPHHAENTGGRIDVGEPPARPRASCSSTTSRRASSSPYHYE